MTDTVAAIMATFDPVEASVDPVENEKATALLQEAVESVLQHIATAGMVVVPVQPALATDYAVFEASVLSHLTPPDDIVKVSDLIVKVADLDASDVNGEAVIHDLRSKGWFILPPK